MPRSYLVLTAVGSDRPGLVEKLTDFIFQCDGNVEASRMATLGGEFAIVMLVSGEEPAAKAIRAKAPVAAREADLECTVKPTKAPREHQPVAEALPYDLRVHSMDHPGIVRDVAHHLAERGVNIESLDTTVEPAPHTGTSVFHLAARLSVPSSLGIPKLRGDLQALAESLNIDIHLSVAED